jgi:hypothetical protein
VSWIRSGSDSAAVFKLTLSAPASIAAAASSSVRMPAADGERQKDLRGHGRDGVRAGLAALDRRGDIEDHDLVDAFDVVAARERRRIAGIAQAPRS